MPKFGAFSLRALTGAQTVELGGVFATHSLYTLSYKFFQRKMFKKALLSFKTAYMSSIESNFLIQKYPVIDPLLLSSLTYVHAFVSQKKKKSMSTFV